MDCGFKKTAKLISFQQYSGGSILYWTQYRYSIDGTTLLGFPKKETGRIYVDGELVGIQNNISDTTPKKWRSIKDWCMEEIHAWNY